MELVSRPFSQEELDEVFPQAPIREVVFEVRFPPKLRILSETWRLQELLTDSYSVAKEISIQASGATMDFTTFQNQRESKVMRVSIQSFLVSLTRYTRFEDFKEEVTRRTEQFCSIFEIKKFSRVGLRYVNEITLSGAEVSSLLAYVKPPLNLERFPLDIVNQFAVEIRTRSKEHLLTIRSALIPAKLCTYVLDIDCYTDLPTSVHEYPKLLEQFHDSAQKVFLDHVTNEFKDVIRREK